MIWLKKQYLVEKIVRVFTSPDANVKIISEMPLSSLVIKAISTGLLQAEEEGWSHDP